MEPRDVNREPRKKVRVPLRNTAGSARLPWGASTLEEKHSLREFESVPLAERTQRDVNSCLIYKKRALIEFKLSELIDAVLKQQRALELYINTAQLDSFEDGADMHAASKVATASAEPDAFLRRLMQCNATIGLLERIKLDLQGSLGDWLCQDNIKTSCIQSLVDQLKRQKKSLTILLRASSFHITPLYHEAIIQRGVEWSDPVVVPLTLHQNNEQPHARYSNKRRRHTASKFSSLRDYPEEDCWPTTLKFGSPLMRRKSCLLKQTLLKQAGSVDLIFSAKSKAIGLVNQTVSQARDFLSRSEDIPKRVGQCLAACDLLVKINLYLNDALPVSVLQNTRKDSLIESMKLAWVMYQLKLEQEQLTELLDETRYHVAQLCCKEIIDQLPGAFSEEVALSEELNHMKITDLSLHDLFKIRVSDRVQVSKAVMNFMIKFHVCEMTIRGLQDYANQCDKEEDFNNVFSRVLETQNCTKSKLDSFIIQREASSRKTEESNFTGDSTRCPPV